MKIVYQKCVGDMASVFHSLFYASNIDALLDLLKTENIIIDKQIKDDFESIRDSKKLSKDMEIFNAYNKALETHRYQ